MVTVTKVTVTEKTGRIPPLMNHSTHQKVVLISGATGGIGRETALLLARKGFRVFAGYREESRGAKLLIEAQKEKLPLSILPLDITLPHQAEEAIKKVIQEAGRIDILINNAGYGLGGPLEELDMREVRVQFETNVFGHIQITQAAIPHMRHQKSGTIIFLSSVSGHLALPFFSAYCATKHAIEAFGEALRYEVKAFGIDVVLLEPGMIRTDFVQKNLILNDKTAKSSSPYHKSAMLAKERYWKKDVTSPPPLRVAQKILDILETERPRLRYRIGHDSEIMILLKKIIPSGWFEYLMLKFYKL